MTDFYLKRTAIIDGDIIAYRAAAWAHGNQGDLHDVVERIESTVEDWRTRACCETAIITLSCSREENFRRDHYPLYKTHRTGDPPAMLDQAKKAIRSLAQTITIPRLEADDVMGILATGTKVINPVIVTIDKDLRTVPGWHFNPDKEDFPVPVSERDADRLFYEQWLTGDSTDGYGGIKGVGPAKAKKILNAPDQTGLDFSDGEFPWRGEWNHKVVQAYADKDISFDECLAQARCARILRASDFDAETRQPIPWAPDNIEGIEE